jgi:hypothetical protein
VRRAKKILVALRTEEESHVPGDVRCWKTLKSIWWKGELVDRRVLGKSSSG